MSLESLFKKRIQVANGGIDDFRRPYMLAQTLYETNFAEDPEKNLSLIIIAQVVRINDAVFVWADGLDMQDPVLLPISSTDDATTRYIDTVSNYFVTHQLLVLEVLECANQEGMDLSPTLVARAVEAMRDDQNKSASNALAVAMQWSQIILDLDRLHRIPATNI